MKPLILFETDQPLYNRYVGTLQYDKYDNGIVIDGERKLSIAYFASAADNMNPAMVLWQLRYVHNPGAIAQLADIRFYGERDVSILLPQLSSRIANSPAYTDKYIEVVNNLIFAPLMPNILIYRSETNGYDVIYANIDGVKRRLRLNNTVPRNSEQFLSTNIYEKYGHEYSILYRTASSLVERSQRLRPTVNTAPVREEQQLSGLHLTQISYTEPPVAGSFTSDHSIVQEDIEYVSSTIGHYQV
jgi:hypothetical protein